ncbi:MAG: recombinase family protein, partial [Chloroflexi bacterium]|nr:recombinase family protein [Chloroflexota bacterium]
MTKRAAIYSRVSTKEQADHGTSQGTQEAAGREYAKRHGYEIVESLVLQEDFTGTTLDRPTIAQLVSAAETGQFDVLIPYTVDRMFRPKKAGDEWMLQQFAAQLRGLGVTIEYADDSIPESGDSAAIMGFIKTMEAGSDRRKILERTSRGTKARIAEGKFTSNPPFGYCKDSEGRLAIDEDEAKIVKMIFNMYERERLGVRKIQVRLTGSVPSPSGKTQWQQSVLSRMLGSEFYWSGRHHLGISMGITDGVPCPPIIDDEHGKRVQARLRTNKRIKKASKSKTILQSRVQCQCGGNWKFQTARKGKTNAEYFCRERYADGPRVLRGEDRCHVRRRGQNELELAIVIRLLEALKSPDNLAATLELSLKYAAERIETCGVEIAPLQQAVRDIDENLATVDRVRINGRLSEEELDAKEKELLRTKAELEGRLAKLDPERITELEEARAMLPAISHLLNWAETYNKPMPIIGMGTIKSFAPTSPPLIEQDVVEMLTLFSPEWFIGEPEKFDDDDWLVIALNEFLDRLHAKITMFDDHAELEGVLPLSIPLGPNDPPNNSIHATHLPRELEGGRMRRGDQVVRRRPELTTG